MKKITPFIDDFLKILTAFTAVLLIVGYINIKTHYGYFGINITAYISASEILIASIDNIALVCIYLVVHLAIWLFFFDHLFNYTDEDIRKGWKEGERRPRLESETIRRFSRNRKLLTIIAIFTIPFFISPLLNYFFPYNKFISQIGIFSFTNIWIILMVHIAGVTFTKQLWDLAKKQKLYNPKFLVSFSLFLPTLLFTVWLNSHLSANYLRRYGNNNHIEILLENNSKIGATDSIRYLGRTENYVFMFNAVTWQNTIYPAGEIKTIFIKR